MKRYMVKTSAAAPAHPVVCAAVVLRDDHMTFYGGEQGEFRVALKAGWSIQEEENLILRPN